MMTLRWSVVDMYRQAIPRLGLSIERDTDVVSEDGLFHVLLKGKEVFVSSSEKEALGHYRKLRDTLLASEHGTPRAPGRDVRQALEGEIRGSPGNGFPG